MIEHIASQDFACSPYRYQNLGDTQQTIASLGLSAENIEGVLRFLRDRGQTDDAEMYLKKPFRLKPQFLDKTRFSDGSIPVYYSAMELETALAEVIFWLRGVLGRATIRTAYYREVQCDFFGVVKDLRDRVHQLPFLVADKSQGG